jgi:hypothetical protein
MATSLQTVVNFNVLATVRQQNDGGPATAQHSTNLSELLFGQGVGFNQARWAFSDLRTLAASANEDLDLVGGFTDGLGNTISPTKCKILIILNYSTTQTLLLKKASSNGAAFLLNGSTDSIYIPPAASDSSPGILFWQAPQGGTALVASTGDLLNVANPSGDSAQYKIIFVGI